MSVTAIDTKHDLDAFVSQVLEESQLAFDVFRETNTITANGTVGFVERVPGQEKLVIVNYPGPFNKHKKLEALVVDFEGNVVIGKSAFGNTRYNKLFKQHPDVTSISHVHSPYLGAWAQAHRPLPIRYVPVQRFNLIREIPIYIDRRQQEVDFILDQIRINPHNTAILEANGGSTVWGKQGLRKLAEFILILEEGALIQSLADSLGGSRDYGPGVLTQQWKMAKIYDQAKELGLLPANDSAPVDGRAAG